MFHGDIQNKMAYKRININPDPLVRVTVVKQPSRKTYTYYPSAERGQTVKIPVVGKSFSLPRSIAETLVALEPEYFEIRER